jgi:hypothetical protein
MRAVALLLAAGLALAAGCGKKSASEIDEGVIENSVYRNDYLGFRMKLPAGWTIQDRQAHRKAAESGAKMMMADEKAAKAMLKAAEQQVVYLVAMSKHPIGTPVAFNPNLGCLAERMADLPGIKTGKDYHFHTRRLLEGGQLRVSFPKEIWSVSLGGKSFDVMYVEISVGRLTVQQKHYASLVRGYAIVCVASYTTPADEAEQDVIMGSVTF